MPLFTVLLTRLLFGVRHSWVVYFSLLPIVLGKCCIIYSLISLHLIYGNEWIINIISFVIGVAIATVTEISFDIVGLLSALMATAGFAIITVYSKKALKDTGMHHLRLLHKLGSMAAIMFLPIWLLVIWLIIIQHRKFSDPITILFWIWMNLFMFGCFNLWM